jgi:tetratricopeptide (TPR) repeat protein
MDSPSARELGHFNWGSTFWHELTHAFTLGATNNRIPRWFSEGLSVLEERRAGQGWGDDVSLQFLLAVQQNKLLPVETLNDGFVRPNRPEQVILSYFQASLICELIEREVGIEGILAMLNGYRDGLGTAAIFRKVLDTDLPAFDARFGRYLREKYGTALASIRQRPAGESGSHDAADMIRRARADTTDFIAQIAAGAALVEGHRPDEAIPYLERARNLFPEYGGENNAYWWLAQIRKGKGQLREAVAELARLTAINESDYRANIEEADLRERLADLPGAAAALERAMYISPMNAALHTRLAGLYTRVGDKPKAVRERRAVLALDPVDQAEARYQLASAYFDAGDAAAARREVLRALEDAPSFEKAQQLLLKIRGSR